MMYREVEVLVGAGSGVRLARGSGEEVLEQTARTVPEGAAPGNHAVHLHGGGKGGKAKGDLQILLDRRHGEEQVRKSP